MGVCVRESWLVGDWARGLLCCFAVATITLPNLVHAQELDVRALRRECWGPTTATGEPVLSACTALIAAGVLRGDDLLAAHQYRGVALRLAGRPQEGLADLELTARERPHAEAFRDLAWTWLALGDRERGLQTLDLAEAQSNVWWGTLYDMARLRFESGDVAGAIRNMRASVRAGGGAQQRNALCWYLATANQSLEEAMQECNRAVRSEPRNAAFIDSRALVKFRNGDFAGAEADYISAVALDPRQAASLYGRGLARMRLGNIERGEADLAAATSKDPNLPATFAALGLVP